MINLYVDGNKFYTEAFFTVFSLSNRAEILDIQLPSYYLLFYIYLLSQGKYSKKSLLAIVHFKEMYTSFTPYSDKPFLTIKND